MKICLSLSKNIPVNVARVPGALDLNMGARISLLWLHVALH